MFEICHSLKNQFGPENWCRYRGMHLMCFADNHDVSRIASVLTNERHLPLLYTLMFSMPGIPCIYYGSEWGAKADKKDGDPALRVSFEQPVFNWLCEHISKLADIKKHSSALNYGSLSVPVLTNKQCIIERRSENERILACINADSEEYTAHFDVGCGEAVDLLTGNRFDFGGGTRLPAYSGLILRCEG